MPQSRVGLVLHQRVALQDEGLLDPVGEIAAHRVRWTYAGFELGRTELLRQSCESEVVWPVFEDRLHSERTQAHGADSDLLAARAIGHGEAPDSGAGVRLARVERVGARTGWQDEREIDLDGAAAGDLRHRDLKGQAGCIGGGARVQSDRRLLLGRVQILGHRALPGRLNDARIPVALVALGQAVGDALWSQDHHPAVVCVRHADAVVRSAEHAVLGTERDGRVAVEAHAVERRACVEVVGTLALERRFQNRVDGVTVTDVTATDTIRILLVAVRIGRTVVDAVKHPVVVEIGARSCRGIRNDEDVDPCERGE